MKLDWSRYKAVVLESDDWGLCAWSPDVEAWHALEATPAFRSAPGRRYGGSTLESADDLRELTALLLAFRGGDGYPPVWQANTVLAAPDYSKLEGSGYSGDDPPLLEFPALPSRWQRPRLWEQLTISRLAGVWWPELHGLHHVPAAAWMDALRRGDADARLAARHEVLVCAAVEASGEYDAREPHTARSWRIEKAVARFREVFGRLPSSVCPPDYRWNEQLEQDLERLSVTTIQGKGEQHGASRGPLTRRLLAPHGIRVRGRRFYLPARIAFEPAVEGAGSSRLGAEAAHRAVRAAWRRGQPAVVSTHRHNLVHLDAARAERGRDALRGLLSRLCEDGAVFLVDREVRELVERGWSAREIGERGVLVRRHAEAPRTIRLPAPADARQVHVRNGRVESATIERGEAHVRLGEGEALFEWERV